MRPSHLDSRAKKTYRDDHETPDEIIQAVRKIFGPIAVDLASSPEANRSILAWCYYSKENPCPDDFLCCDGTVIWCNPPGPGKKVQAFWKIFKRAYEVKYAEGAFLLFNMDHWRQLEPPLPGFGYFVTILKKRLKFKGNKNGASFPSALITTKHPFGCGLSGQVVRW